jgi:hypothetical protein
MSLRFEKVLFPHSFMLREMLGENAFSTFIILSFIRLYGLPFHLYLQSVFVLYTRN